MRMFVLALAACSSAHHVTSPDGTTMTDATVDAAAPLNWGERCGNGIDDDGDGLVDEDCAPSLFAGVFAPGVANDPVLGQVHVAVVQTYRATKQPDAGLIEQDLGAIFAGGYVAHLNLEPAGYSSYTPEALHDDLAAVAQEIASALAAHPGSRVIVTFGAEMNGSWTDWGCLPAAQYIAVYRAAHDAVSAALGTIDPRRVRWAYGPNSTSSANCGSVAGYYPGHAYVDLLGLSAYRSGSASVDAAVITPIDNMFSALGYPDAWQDNRFVVLQTGSRAATDRDQWVSSLVTQATADRRIAGIIYFDEGDWSLPSPELGEAIGMTGTADPIFLPHFWDVPYSHPAFPEIQGLADAHVTSGCADAPPQFCPDDAITAADAAALVARAVPGSHIELTDPVTETALASALVGLGLSPPAAHDITATRARAAVLIAHAARSAPHSNL